MKFLNPANDYEEEVTTGISWLWVLLWAPIYYAVKGIWIHAIVSFVVALILFAPISYAGAAVVGIVYAILNRKIVRSYYLRKGWVERAD